MNIIENYLIEKGLEYKAVNDHYCLRVSPLSWEDKRNHFYINAVNGMRDDKKIWKAWNFNQFRELFNDQPIILPDQEVSIAPKEYKIIPFETVRWFSQALWWLKPDLLNYLISERNLDEKTIKHFKLGADWNSISIPIFDAQDNLVNIRRRKNPKDTNPDMPKYYTESWCRSILFNEYALSRNPMEVILTEWEFDAMMLWQAWLTNVVSVTLWAGYFSSEWADQFKNVKRVYIAFDNDRAWKEWLKKAYEHIGADKCRIIELPKPTGVSKMDISDWFNKHWGTKEDFLKLMNKAKSPMAIQNNENIKHISEFNEELRNRLLSGDYKGISTGFPWLDAIIGWYRKGRVVVLSGLTSTGKTTYSCNLTQSLALRNVPTLFISMEMWPIDVCKKFLMLQKRLNWFDLDSLTMESPLIKTIDEGLLEFSGSDGKPWLPIYLASSTGELNLKNVIELCRVSKETYWTEVIVIDHLHYFAQKSDNRASEVSTIIREIKNMAMELDIPVILLAHMNRWWRQQQRKWLYIPALSDLRESGAIEQDADQVLFVCRDSECPDEKDKRKTIIKVAKNRDGSTWYVSYDFELWTGLFLETEEDYMAEMSSKLKDTSKQKMSKDDIVKPNDALF
jgi:replicative DNA helicase